MKNVLIALALSVLAFNLNAQDVKTIPLNVHSKVRGSNLMEAFQNRQSIRSFDAKELSLQDLSDLLWAANGINRPESGKRTAPSCINIQDVDLYVCMSSGAYLYDATANTLKQITSEDIRSLSEGSRPNPSGAPVVLLLITDISRYKDYKPENKEANQGKNLMAAIDAGIVSQNIGIFCAGAGFGTVPRAGMNQALIRKALNLKESQTIWLNHPIGYPKK